MKGYGDPITIHHTTELIPEENLRLPFLYSVFTIGIKDSNETRTFLTFVIQKDLQTTAITLSITNIDVEKIDSIYTRRNEITIQSKQPIAHSDFNQEGITITQKNIPSSNTEPPKYSTTIQWQQSHTIPPFTK